MLCDCLLGFFCMVVYGIQHSIFRGISLFWGFKSNVLDEYEEGTFTPSVASTSGSFSAVGTVLGFYTKIGRMVHVQCSITVTNVGSGSANIDITGLPFTSASTGPVHTMMTSARETQVLGQNDEVIMSRDVSALVILGAHFGNGMEYSVNFIYRAAT